MLGSVQHQNSSTRIVRLEAHAAVRLSEVSDDLYDCYDLPVEKGSGSSRKGSSFAKKMKTLASYLTTRINPSFQECHVEVVESMRGLALEVRPAAQVKSQASGASYAGVSYSAPLATLLDVSTDAVIEKDNVVFTHLPDSFPTGAAEGPSGGSPRPAASKSKPSKKDEIISTLFRAYGDIGLILAFRAPRATARVDKPITKVTLRFLSTAERNEWMSFCVDAYVGLLLDSLRGGDEKICLPAVVDEAAAAVGAPRPATQYSGGMFPGSELKPPPRAVVEKYVDFFLSSRSGEGGAAHHHESRGDSDDMESAAGSNPTAPPSDGVMQVRRPGERHAHPRRLWRTARTLSTADRPASSGQPQISVCLAIQPAKRSPLLRGRSAKELVIPIDSFTTYAEDDQHGETFFLELSERSGGDTFSRTSQRGSCGPETLELTAGSHTDRRRWIDWFGAVLGKRVVFLNRAREEAESRAALESRSKSQFLGRDTAW